MSFKKRTIDLFQHGITILSRTMLARQVMDDYPPFADDEFVHFLEYHSDQVNIMTFYVHLSIRTICVHRRISLFYWGVRYA